MNNFVNQNLDLENCSDEQIEQIVKQYLISLFEEIPFITINLPKECTINLESLKNSEIIISKDYYQWFKIGILNGYRTFRFCINQYYVKQNLWVNSYHTLWYKDGKLCTNNSGKQDQNLLFVFNIKPRSISKGKYSNPGM